ncbi:hypothetical protein [Christiangramia sp. SM2212]|uniref:Lipoprotein n=1 Tax=Christiangramia sediminicola TaxID=3073267 RepID=A0ABU1ES69_9FLAO|nr:hypothetical protein [Christiangramia sp. SM2212]MDR5591236.1 hypothetical protein [Christiangramia sp. SM2212]
MNKKLLMLGLGLGVFLVGCQSDPVTEDLQSEEVSAVKNVKETNVNKIHEPGFIGAIHEPGFLKNGFEDCDIFPIYEGSKDLHVAKGEVMDFSDHTHLENLRVAGELNICGEIETEKNAIIRRNGEMTTVGLAIIGSEEEPKDLVINYGGHFNINGALVVTGDLIINTGGTLQFLNDDLEHNYLWVMGEIRQAEYSFMQGAYNVYEEDHDHDHEH